MCGILGMMGSGIIEQDLEWFRQTLLISALRGEDSTGVYAGKIRYGAEKHWIKKDTDDASEWLYQDRIASKKDSMFFPGDLNLDLYMGHCRYATLGTVNVVNAQPLETKGLIGTHNGTLSSSKFQPKVLGKDKLGKPIYESSDSMVFFNEMTKGGIRETLVSANEYTDAWAVAVYRKNSKELVLSTNGERPLHIAISTKRGVMYWASEMGMLTFIMGRIKQTGKPMLDDVNIYRLLKNVVYTFPINEVRANNLTPWHADDISQEIIDARAERWKALGIVNTSGKPWDDDDWVREYSNIQEANKKQAYVPLTDRPNTTSVPVVTSSYGERVGHSSGKPGTSDSTVQHKSSDKEFCRACNRFLTLKEINNHGVPKRDAFGRDIYFCDDCSGDKTLAVAVH